jgi:RNA polymerase sigma-70 factor (ECF subfamily)
MAKLDARETIAAFILANRDSLYRLAYSYVGNKEDAMDILGDTICKALSSARSLKNPAVVKAWIFRIAVNSALDFLRKRRRDLYLESDAVASESDMYQDIDLQTALARLSTRNRTIIALRFYEDMKIEEIAEVLGENINTIKTALYSSLRRLRVELDDHGPGIAQGGG